MSDYQVKDAKGALLVHDEGNGFFEALVSITNVVDNGHDMILPGAYQQTIKARQHPKLLAGHNWDRQTGKVLQMEEWFPNDPRLPEDLRFKGAGALWIKGRFNLGTMEGREAYARVKFLSEDDPLGCEWSIGYDCSPTPEGIRATHRNDGVRLIKSLDLLECSDVVVGMVPATRALMVKAYNTGKFEQLNPERKYSLGELIGYATKDARPDEDDVRVDRALDKMKADLSDAVEAQKDDDRHEGVKVYAQEQSGDTSDVQETTPVSDEKGAQTQQGRETASNVSHPTPTGGPGYRAEDGVDAGDDIHPMPLPETVPTAKAGEDKTTQTGEMSFTKARYTAAEWAERLGMLLERKDWSEYDESHPDRGKDEEGGGDSGESSEPSSTATGTNPPTSGEPPSQPSAPKAPAPSAAPEPPQQSSTEEPWQTTETSAEHRENEAEGNKLGKETGGFLEHLSKLGEAIHEGVEEGKEKGSEWAESFEHHGSQLGGAAHGGAKAFGEIQFGYWPVEGKAIDMPATDVDDEVQQNNPVIPDEDGNKSDMTHMVDAPEDAALKRGVPDEYTMRSDSAMKSWKGIQVIELESKDWAVFDAARGKLGRAAAALKLESPNGSEGHGWSKNDTTHTKTTDSGHKLTVHENTDGSASRTRHSPDGKLSDSGHVENPYNPAESGGLGDYDDDPVEDAKTDAEISARTADRKSYDPFAYQVKDWAAFDAARDAHSHNESDHDENWSDRAQEIHDLMTQGHSVDEARSIVDGDPHRNASNEFGSRAGSTMPTISERVLSAHAKYGSDPKKWPDDVVNQMAGIDQVAKMEQSRRQGNSIPSSPFSRSDVEKEEASHGVRPGPHEDSGASGLDSSQVIEGLGKLGFKPSSNATGATGRMNRIYSRRLSQFG